MAIENTQNGRFSHYWNPEEISQLLVQYIERRLRTLGDARQIRQSEIAVELGVSQPMVNAIIHGRRVLSEEKVWDYAKKLGMEFGGLLQEILLLPNADGFDENSLRMQVDDSPFIALMSKMREGFERIDEERRQAKEQLDKSFDSECIYADSVEFVTRFMGALGIGGLGVAVVSISGSRLFIVSHPVGARNKAFTRIQLNHASPLIEELLRAIDGSGRNIHATAEINLTAESELLSNSGEDVWILHQNHLESRKRDGYRFLIQHVFSESVATTDGHGLRQIMVLAIPSPNNVSDHQWEILKQTLFVGCRLAERASFYTIEDRLHLAEMAADAGFRRSRILDPMSWTFNGFEWLERDVDNLIHKLFLADWAGQIATADAWVYDAPSREFVSPTESFRGVAQRHSHVLLKVSDGTSVTLEAAYEAEHARGNLDPRPFGRTTYMIGNQVAMFCQSMHGHGHPNYWSSSQLLNIGTFIGIPFFFSPHQQSHGRHACVLYIRCVRDLQVEEATRLIQDICVLMKSCSNGSLEPMFGVRGLCPRKRSVPGKGKWYEVSSSRKKKPDNRRVTSLEPVSTGGP